MTPDTLEERIRHIIDDLHVDWFKEKADKRYVVEAIKALIEEETDKVEERYVGRLADEIFRREALEAKLKLADEALYAVNEWWKIRAHLFREVGIDDRHLERVPIALNKIRSSEGGEG